MKGADQLLTSLVSTAIISRLYLISEAELAGLMSYLVRNLRQVFSQQGLFIDLTSRGSHFEPLLLDCEIT